MTSNQLMQLGDKLAKLRIAKRLKQSELAYEAGISERTLQRIEAGQVVKSDGLLNVISYLGRLEPLLTALGSPDFSPLELAKQQAKRPHGVEETSAQYKPSSKSRVRHSASKARTAHGDISWPEDQT